MELTRYVDTVRQGVNDAAALADEHSRQVADRLGQAVDASTRLALIRALSDATAEISTELAPGVVEMRLSDGDPHFSVTLPQESAEPTMIMPEPQTETQAETAEDTEPGPDEDDQSPTARISLRLPLSVKEKVDRAADAEGISTNTWLVRAVQDALEPARPQPQGHPGPGGLGQIFGPDGPFGTHGVFGPHGPFGPGDPRTDPRTDPRRARLRKAARDWARNQDWGDGQEWSPGSTGENRPRGRGRGGEGWGEGRGRVQGWVR